MSTLDKLNTLMSPCTSLWGQAEDKLMENESIGFIAARAVGPIVFVPLLADAALHVGSCALKALYAFSTRCTELVINAFNVRPQHINPLGTYTWTADQAAGHLWKAIECIGMIVWAAPISVASPDLAVRSVRYFNLASPPAPKTPTNDPKDSGTLAKIWESAGKITNIALKPLDMVHALFARYPLFTTLALNVSALAALGFGIAFASNNGYQYIRDWYYGAEEPPVDQGVKMFSTLADTLNPQVEKLNTFVTDNCGETSDNPLCPALKELQQGFTTITGVFSTLLNPEPTPNGGEGALT